MASTYSAAEIAAEAACSEDRVRWLAEIGLLAPDEHGRFTFGDVLASKMASALLDSGMAAETIEHAAAEGLLSFQRTDEYLPHEPGPRSGRTFAEFQAGAGPRAELLPALYEVLGLPKPDPSAPLHVDEEAMLRDLDVFGQTVNLASRIADVAGPGEVLASEAVVEAAGGSTFGFERLDDAQLKGLPDPVALFRVTRPG